MNKKKLLFPADSSGLGRDNQEDNLSNFSEAEEASVYSNENKTDSEGEEEGEDLFGPDMLRDYENRPELDTYDSTLIDDASQAENMRPEDRARVEKLLDARDRHTAKMQEDSVNKPRPYQGLRNLFGPEEDEQEDEVWKMLRERRDRLRSKTDLAGRFPIQQAEQAKDELPYCAGKASWTQRVAEILEVVFTGFIYLYRRPLVNSEGPNQSNDFNRDETQVMKLESTYVEAINELAHADSISLRVSWDDLRLYCPKVLEWIYQIPLNTLNVFDATVTRIIEEKYPKLYSNRRVTARIYNYEAIDSIRSLNTESLNTLVSVRGVIIRRTNIQPRLKLIWFTCTRCECDIGPYEKHDNETVRLRGLICLDCQGKGPFRISREKTRYENFQRLTIQEPPGQVNPGYVPKQRQVIVLGDLVDTIRPGDEVVVTGVYQTRADPKLNAQSGFPVFATEILANNIERTREMQMTEITDQDLEIIHKLSKNPFIREKIIDSIAPSIWGYRHIKTGLAYAMLGGVSKQTCGNHFIRGDINFLILGDPGVGKSQFLKYVEKTFDRTVYTTGKGSSAVGLTAAIRRDETTGEWYLEGGALVLADQGICLIDEFDKMADQDRVSIHEAMEQQSISISKAGIIATLKARCSIIAAANPLLGRYDSSLTFAENVDLTDPILSRFDILAVVKDQVHPVTDEHLAEHVVSSHACCHPDAQPQEKARFRVQGRDPEDPDIDGNVVDATASWITGTGKIPQPVLRKYLLYARRNCIPKLRPEDEKMSSRFYSEIRQASMTGGGIPMTVRHLESVMRMACANAKMRLSPFVEKRDMYHAISTMVESFIQSQKYAVAVQLGKRFGRYRALAASPDEFIENVLMDQLSRNTRKLLQGRRVDDSKGTDLIHEAVDQAQVGVNQLLCLVRSMYNLPEAAVNRFMQSERFKRYFSVFEAEIGVEGMQAVIRRSPKDNAANAPRASPSKPKEPPTKKKAKTHRR